MVDSGRLTNAFLEKLENHAPMVALYFMYFDFGRIHQAFRVPPGNGRWDRGSHLVD